MAVWLPGPTALENCGPCPLLRTTFGPALVQLDQHAESTVSAEVPDVTWMIVYGNLQRLAVGFHSV